MLRCRKCGFTLIRTLPCKNLVKAHPIRGFTLIELLVVISIIGIMAAVGIPSFTTFNRSQGLKNTASELKSNLRFAQQKALSGDKSGCTGTLVGWYATFASTGTNATSYNLTGRCKNSGTESDGQSKTYSLPSSIYVKSLTSAPPVYALFGAVTTGNSFHSGLPFFDSAGARQFTISANPLEIVLTNGNNDYRVCLNTAGKIYDYEQQNICPAE